MKPVACYIFVDSFINHIHKSISKCTIFTIGAKLVHAVGFPTLKQSSYENEVSLFEELYLKIILNLAYLS